ncbi:MAG TPA: O-antigen ligase family protein [Bacteroidales bacterium]|nr:O-antigen ligase family protein [Bacteroidales bacterium]HPS63131.1 O-antigen ligase family protein [Bacteroidales bacterium]
MMNQMEISRGAERLKRPAIIGFILICATFTGVLIARWGFMVELFLVALPLLLIILTAIFLRPGLGLYLVFVLNYFALGIYRYLNMIPWGLTVDILLVITYLSLVLQMFHRKVEWGRARNDLVLLAALWFLYSFLEMLNPEAGSRVAWFYSVRGISLYMILTIPLVFVIFHRRSDMRMFFLLWGIFSLMGSLKGIQQKFIGLDPWEQRWLDEGGAAQHLLFGELRIFSFFSDAGQFGAAQGMAGVVFGILALGEKNRRRKLFYAMVALPALYSMMISGTRGAISVPFAGILLYIVMKKNYKVMTIGLAALVAVFVFFNYTFIGQSNSTIRRMRTAFNPEDASLQTRLTNQQRIKGYLSSRPFGGGVGSTGSVGQKYNPGSFLSTVPTDSWYVMIWMEEGVVGLVLHLCILAYILGKAAFLAMFRLKNESVRTPVMAMAAGMAGIMVASYGNPVLGQMPVGIILYTCMAFMFMAPAFDREITTEQALTLQTA